jgi:hypothetical protein
MGVSRRDLSLKGQRAMLWVHPLFGVALHQVAHSGRVFGHAKRPEIRVGSKTEFAFK